MRKLGPGRTWLGDSTMTDAKDFLPRSFRIDNIVKSAALSAVLCAACVIPTAAFAQGPDPGTITTNTSTITTTTLSTVPVIDPVAPGAQPGIDYRILANPNYDYAQIVRARSYGMSDKNIVRAISLANMAGVPTSDVLDQLRDGWTFATVQSNYGISSEWIANDDTDKLDNYIAAYHATGRWALKNSAYDDSNTAVTKTLAYNETITSSSSMGDIIHTLRSNSDFKTFSKALRRTGLDRTLEGSGPFTVFAPSDSAFAALPKDEMKSIWNNKAELTEVLQYHVLPTQVSAAQAMAMTSPTSPATLEGDTLQVTSSNSQVMINGNLVTTPDIQASNGVIHELDAVLIPNSVATAWNNTSGNNGTTGMTPPTVTTPNGATTTPNGTLTMPMTTPNAVTPAPGATQDNTTGTTTNNTTTGTPPPVTVTPAVPGTENGMNTTVPGTTGTTNDTTGTSAGTTNNTSTGTSTATPATGGGNSGTIGSTTGTGATQ